MNLGIHAIRHIEYKVGDNRKYFNGPKKKKDWCFLTWNLKQF